MPKKYMNDFQRVKAGNWLENQKTWIATDPSIQMIAEQATTELGHRVTTTFVKSYLSETEWFAEMRRKGGEPVVAFNVQRSVEILIEIIEQMMSDQPIPTGEIEGSIKKAKSLIGTSEKGPSEPTQLDLITEAQMKAGHA